MATTHVKWMVAGLVLLLTGCQAARLGTPVTEKAGGDDGASQIEFWHALENRPIASNDEAFHALLLFFDGKDASADYAGRVAAMKSRGLIGASFADPDDAAVRRGTLSVAMARGLKIEGGVLMRVTGSAPRYALRELQYLKLLPESSENQSFSGSDFVGVIGKLEDYEKVAIGKQPGGEAAIRRREAIARLNELRVAMVVQDDSRLARRDRVRAPLVGVLADQCDLGKGHWSAEEPPTSGTRERQFIFASGPGPDAAVAAGDETLKATVTAVQGVVQYRGKEGDAWAPVKVGLVLDQGAEFRTALRSVVVFTTPPGNTVTLDRLGTIKVVEAMKHDGKSRTNLGMKYGVSQVHVEAGGPEHETTICTPGSTLAVRGTTAWVTSIGPSFPDQTRVADGLAHYTTHDGKSYDFAGKGQDSTTNTAASSPADVAVASTVFNPTASAQTSSEQQVIQNNQVAVPVISAIGGSSPVSVPTPPPVEPPVVTTATGNFKALAFWFDPVTGTSGGDMELVVTTPSGHVVSRSQSDPAGLLIHSASSASTLVNFEEVFTTGGVFELGTYHARLINNMPVTLNFNINVNVDTPRGGYGFTIGPATGVPLAPGATSEDFSLQITDVTSTVGLSAKVVTQKRH